MPKDNLKGRVFEVLRSVKDPELGFDVVSLGLIYDVDIKEGGGVFIKMTLTSMGCPLAGYLLDAVRQAAEGVPGVKKVKVDLVFEPVWSIDRVAPEVRAALNL